MQMGRGGHSNGDSTRAENEDGGGGGGDTTITTTMTRIYIGGLGATVTADDLRKTFSNLGVVESIDIVRTKDRSFAYLDFVPSSDKSLSKLFSTYNGCSWKGGRLRLENAKEHYLLRLKKEWAEDAKLESSAPSNGVGATKEVRSPEKSKKLLNPEKTQLNLFFPKLKKLKSLPFSGTGKHKYSFQRVEVPRLPTHFCDCEEHSHPVYTRKEKNLHDIEAQRGGVNEEELNIMNSVMNKLFERNNVSKSAHIQDGLATAEYKSVSKSPEIGDELATPDDNSTKIDDQVDNEEVDHVEDEDEDEDNLIMNMVAGGNDIMSFQESLGHETVSANEEPILDEPQTSIDRSTRNKKRKSPSIENGDGNASVSAIPERKRRLQSELRKSGTLVEDQIIKPESSIVKSNTKRSWSQKSSWRDLVGEGTKNPFHLTDFMPKCDDSRGEQLKCDDSSGPEFMESKNQNVPEHENLELKSSESKETKGLLDVEPTKPNELANKSGRGAAWLKKSSWTQLVAETNNNPFSISQILPGITFEKHEVETPNAVDASNSSGGTRGNSVEADRIEPTRNGSKAFEVTNKDAISNKFSLEKKGQNHTGEVEQRTPEKNMKSVGENKEVLGPKLDRKDQTGTKQTSGGKLEISETCAFVRNAASVKEWAKTKAALRGSAKKKGEEK